MCDYNKLSIIATIWKMFNIPNIILGMQIRTRFKLKINIFFISSESHQIWSNESDIFYIIKHSCYLVPVTVVLILDGSSEPAANVWREALKRSNHLFHSTIANAHSIQTYHLIRVPWARLIAVPRIQLDQAYFYRIPTHFLCDFFLSTLGSG